MFGVFCIFLTCTLLFSLFSAFVYHVAVCSRIIRFSFVLLEFLILGYDDDAKRVSTYLRSLGAPLGPLSRLSLF